MTDETREQIKNNADKYAHEPGHIESVGVCVYHFTNGATHQHPISYEAGRKEGIEESLEIINRYEWAFVEDRDRIMIIKELEALKTEKP